MDMNSKQTPPEPSSVSVLVVDDDEDLRDTLCSLWASTRTHHAGHSARIGGMLPFL